MGALFFFGYEAALYLGLDLTASLVVGAMLSITSTAIMFKIVAQKGLAKNPMMPLLFSMLIVEDVVAVAALTFFSSLSHGTPTYEDKIYSVLVSLGLLGLFYFVVRRPSAKAILRLTSTLSQEVMIFVSFSLCLMMSMVAGYFELSPAIGAFLAGSIISTLPNVKSIEKTLKPLLLMFASLFFLSLGMQIDPAVILGNFWLASALTALFVTVGFVFVFGLLYFTGADVKNSIFGASAMVVLGEFSLLIASVYAGPYSSLLIAVGSFGVVVTAIISSFLLDHREQIYSLEQRAVPEATRRAAEPLSIYLSGIIRDFSPNGSFWKISRVCWGCVSRKLIRIAAIAVVVFAARAAIRLLAIEPASTAAQMRASIFVLGMIPIAYFIFKIILDIRPMLNALSSTIIRHKKDAKPENIILRDLSIAVALIAASFSLPELAQFLQLPPFFNWGDEVLFLLALVFVWDVIVQARKLHAKRKKSRSR